MNPERYQQICDVFAEAGELSAEQRRAFLDAACAGDADLRREVESMLAASEESGDFIESPAFEVAAEILAEEQANSKIGLEINQYKIVSPLGAGGMGEVWLAEDARLKRSVALKLLSDVGQDDFSARFEQEAHAASALNHPNIITIFDIGRSAELQFIATEYINGKTLRELMREKPLGVAEAVEIAAQICAALAAAHHAGIIHRDIKPENVMVRADGIVKVLDFGLARFSVKNTSNPNQKFITKPGMIVGTLTYMSPEQARALPLDERTDVFSLGIVLYEMLTGKQPFVGVNDVEVLVSILERAPQEMNGNMPAALKQIVVRALEKNPLERLTAEELLDDLRRVKRELEYTGEIAKLDTANNNLHNLDTVRMTAITGSKPPPTGNFNALTSAKSFVRAMPRRPTFAALALLLAAFAGFAFYQFSFRNNQPAVLNDADRLLIAEFENRTGDEEFDETFRQPLAVGLAQSPFVWLVPDGQIRQTLKQMERPPGERLTAEIALEICRRRGIKAFLTGAIENYGVKYRITLEAFDAATGAPVARETAEAADKETVIDALDRATGGMREKLGESLASIKRFDQPLKTSTTASLEALKTYSLATKILSEGKIEDGIVLLKQATEIDPNYASAYASLAAAYNNRGQMSVAAEYAAKAFALRDRMTERERQKITGFYYVFVTGETEKDIENLEAAKQSFPRDSTIPLNLGASYIQLGKFVKAEENARLAINLEPTLFFARSNLGRYLSRQSRFEESKAVYEDALERQFESDQITSGLYTAAFALGDSAEMQRQLEILAAKDQAAARRLQGNAAIFSGRARDYEKLMSQTIEAEKDRPDAAADHAAQTATNLAAVGKCPNAQDWANRALKLDRGQQILTDATLVFALCAANNETQIAELKQRFPKNTAVNSLWLPLIRAASEMKTAPERALETLEINRQFEGATYFWDNYLRGKIYLQLNQPDLAATEFQKIIANRGWSVSSPLFALAHSELTDIYKLNNNQENARRHSEIFADLWKNADSDLAFAPRIVRF